MAVEFDTQHGVELHGSEVLGNRLQALGEDIGQLERGRRGGGAVSTGR